MQDNWKKWFFRGAGFGAGFAVAGALVLVFAIWYEQRPKPPKPWNKEAVTAEFDRLGTEGDKNDIVFYYVLQNNTDFDYSVSELSDFRLAGRLDTQRGLTVNDEVLKPDIPVWIPAHSRLRFAVHLAGYPYSERENSDATPDEHKRFGKKLEGYVNTTMSNLDGFELFDNTRRYQIVLPSGWKEDKKQ